MLTAHQDLLTKDLAHLIHPLHNRRLHETEGHIWVRGNGPFLYDVEGREFIDGLSGLWNVVAGHGRSELADVAAKQMQALGYCSGYAGSSNPQAIELAARLAEISYPGISHFYFTSGGAEANDTAFKTARYYWRARGKPEKTKVISRQWGYHGVTMAAMSATGIASYWPMFEPLVPGFVQIPSPYPYRYVAPEGLSPGVAAAQELEKAILREGADTVAMFLAEPVQGAGGVIPPPDDYFPAIRAICDQYQVLFVADEVITGFGRTGAPFGLMHWGIEPDMFTFAKAITSGYFPLGGVGMTSQVAATLNDGVLPWMHAFTYSAHPVGCAVALRTLDIIQDEGFCDQAKEKGARLLTMLQSALGSHPHVGEIRGKGLMCGIEFVKDRATKTEFPASEKVGSRVHTATQKHGLYSRLRGESVFCIAPPIITSDAVLDRIVEIMDASIREVLG